ncbi:MAG: nucleotidyl transferase AbiEii/AbiGii toxin family protein [Pseudomonadota bacterium]
MQYSKIFKAFKNNDVKFIIVGGIAVNLHGVQRATADLDIVIALDSENVLKFINAITALNLKPKAPVDIKNFADPKQRKLWKDEKGMMVFSFFDPTDSFVQLDVFIEEPIPFKEMFKRREKRTAFGIPISIASIADLISMKKKTGRHRDELDLEALNALAKRENT